MQTWYTIARVGKSKLGKMDKISILRHSSRRRLSKPSYQPLTTRVQGSNTSELQIHSGTVFAPNELSCFHNESSAVDRRCVA